jgi:hypothetical protein
MDRLAGLIHRVLSGITSFSYQANRGALPRGKVEPDSLAFARAEIAALIDETADAPRSPASDDPAREPRLLRVRGPRATAFLQVALPASVASLAPGEARRTTVHGPGGEPIGDVAVARATEGELPEYVILPERGVFDRVIAWLRDLSDGYVRFDPVDLHAR